MIGFHAKPAVARPIITLILTHPTNNLDFERPGSSRICRANWRQPPVACDDKLWLYTKSGYAPRDLEMDKRSQVKFSNSGALDEEDNTILEAGFIGRGHTHYILGGGFLDLCLSSTFESLVRLASKKRERLVVFGALPIIYSPADLNRADYLRNGNAYSQFLFHAFRDRKITGYSIYYDGELIARSVGHEKISLSWHTTLAELIASPLWLNPDGR